jgi:hypothetical protein
MNRHDPHAAPPPLVDSSIRGKLAGLRCRIRLYVLVQGLAAVVIWLSATFWAGFALDYLPVLVGASEMPRAARAVLLAAVSIGAAYVLYRWLLARLLVSLSDRSMALLLERRHREFHDGLVTTVEMAGHEREGDILTQDMLAATAQRASEQVRQARLSPVFNYRPLATSMVAATLLAATIAAAFAANASAMTQAARRLYALDDTLWERFARIEVLGVEVRRPLEASDGAAMQSLAFNDGSIKVARGSNLTLRVQADAGAPVVPEQCYLNYRTAEGDRGTVTMKRVGRAKDGVQLYVCDAKPLAGILSSLDFDVLGYDHRVSGFRIEVVDSPAVVGATMDLVYPAYMVDEANAIHVPRQGEPVLASGNALPLGTQATLYFASSKPLAEAVVRVLDPEAAEAADQEIERLAQTFATAQATDVLHFFVKLPPMRGSRSVEVMLRDTDGVASERPFRAFFNAVADDPPRWELALQGIGTAVTPDVIVPLKGKVTDDYGVAAAWLETIPGDVEPVRFELQPQRGSEFTQAIDFRRERAERPEFQLEPGQKLTIFGRAHDRFDLDGGPNEAISERYVLDVVTPDQLLIALEARELGLRRRFEVMIEELTAMRDSLLRIKAGPVQPSESLEPEEAEPGERRLSPEELARREVELRLLRVQRAVQQSRKSAQEIAGVAQSFDAIREELTNNRMDTEDRKSRLKEQIADPLHAAVSTDFPALEERLIELETLLDDSARGQGALDGTVRHANELLAKLDQVLQKMMTLESYNEIVDLVRELIKEQHALLDETRREQRRDLEE